MKIKAYAIKKKGGKPEPFFYHQKPGKNDVLVRITHCSIARGDIQFIDNDWGDTKFPLVPGHEIIGIIEAAGSQVAGLREGDRVGIGYQQSACFKCKFCKEGNEQFCPKQQVIGVDCYGGLAEHIVVDSRFAFKLPSKLDLAKSVPLLSAGLTGYAGIIKAKLPRNSMVAVLGVGGLGQLAIQFLHKMGHRVAAFSSSPGKRGMIDQMGAAYIDSSNPDQLTGYTRKFDFILSTLNVDFDLNAYLKMLQPQGKFCMVASPLKGLSISQGILYDYVQRTIYGNYIGSRKDMVNMLAFAAKHHIESMVEVMPFSGMNEAISVAREGRIPGRLVLENTW